MIKVLLFKPSDSSGLFERLVCWGTGSPYCHVGLLLKAEYANTVAEALPDGFHVHDYGQELDYLIGKGLVDVYSLKYPLSKNQEQAIINYCKSIEGSPYDTWDLIDIAFRILTLRTLRLGSKNKFICTEAVSLALKEGGITLVPYRDDDDLSPGDIANSKLLKKD